MVFADEGSAMYKLLCNCALDGYGQQSIPAACFEYSAVLSLHVEDKQSRALLQQC